MSTIRPFVGFLPKAEKAGVVSSVPYDTISSDEAREIASDKPDSFLYVVKPEINFPIENVPSERTDLYPPGKSALEKLIEKGELSPTEKPCYYVYKQTFGEHVQYGLVAASSSKEYQDGVIKKHEHTLKAKEDLMAGMIDFYGSDCGPVLLIYPALEAIDQLIENSVASNPLIDFEGDDGFTHTVWIIEEDDVISQITDLFDKQIPSTYIADGHHRAASAGRVAERRAPLNPDHTGEEEYNFFLTVLIPDNQLKILDYNRAVKDLNGKSTEEVIEFVSEKFDLEKLDVSDAEEARPNNIGEFAMLLDGNWYRLNVKSEFVPNDPVNSLDVALLQNLVLEPLLGIDNPRANPRIDFIGGIRGLGELERRCSTDCKIAFGLYPTSAQQLFDVADAGMVMPPKSTWFEPKQRSGLIVRRF